MKNSKTGVKAALTAFTSGLLMLCAGGALAQTSNISNAVSGYDANLGPGTIQPFSVTSDTSPVTYTTPSPCPSGAVCSGTITGEDASSTHSGVASAAQQTLKASAEVYGQSASGQFALAKTYSSFQKDVYVSPATTGAAIGATVLLPITLHLSGNVAAGSLCSGSGGSIGACSFSEVSGARVLSSVDTSMSYRIFDLDRLDCSEGPCRPVQIASFSYGGRAVFDYAVGDASSYEEIRYGWDYQTNVDPYFEGANVNTFSSVSAFGSTSYTVDTDVLNLQIETLVGHNLRIEGGLDIFLQALGIENIAGALGNFAHTFDVDLGGVGEIPGVYSVAAIPEPEIYAMLGVGLGLMGWAARRRKVKEAA